MRSLLAFAYSSFSSDLTICELPWVNRFVCEDHLSYSVFEILWEVANVLILRRDDLLSFPVPLIIYPISSVKVVTG